MDTDTIAPAPHALLAEKSVLSAMFQKPESIARAAAEGITAEAFHIPAHQEILSHLIKSRDAGHFDNDGGIDTTVFIQTAQMDGTLGRMGGPSSVMDVAGYALSLSGWSAWCDILRECKARRIAQDASRALAEIEDSGEAIKAARDALERMQRAVTAKTRSVRAKEACEEFISYYVRSFENGDIPGQSTGIPEIDAVTGGMRPGELFTVGGPSSAGKSALMYQIASEFLGGDQVVAIFSAELPARDIVGRLTTLRARVQYDAITKPKSVTKREMMQVQAAVKEIAATRMWIDATAGQSLESIMAESERVRDIEGKVGLIVVDYIQIIKGMRSKGDSREQEIASISGGLKQLAKRMDCPVLTATQLNDDGKTRESRAIEQDSDVLLIIQDDGLLLKKVRNGERGSTINIALDGPAQRFRYFRPDTPHNPY